MIKCCSRGQLLSAVAIFAVFTVIFTATPIIGFSLHDASCASAAFITSISCAERRALRLDNIGLCGSSMSRRNQAHRLSMSSESNNNDMNNNSLPDGEPDKKRTRRTDENKNEVIEELSWRVAKARLEEENKRRILKRKPLKLPYAVSQKWLQRNWGPKTQKEFEDLVANGDLKNVYISKRPEEYYGARGEWISWDHYLLGECSEDFSTNSTDSKMKWQ